MDKTTKEHPIRQYDVWWADIPYYSENVIAGDHPVIIISNDQANAKSASVVAIPCTSTEKRLDLPIHVQLKKDKSSVAHVENLITIDKDCLRNFYYHLHWKKIRDIKTAIMTQLGFL